MIFFDDCNTGYRWIYGMKLESYVCKEMVLPRVGPRQALAQPAPRGRCRRRARLEEKRMEEGGWE